MTEHERDVVSRRVVVMCLDVASSQWVLAALITFCWSGLEWPVAWLAFTIAVISVCACIARLGVASAWRERLEFSEGEG